MPSPQVSVWQPALQPSPDTVLLSSHCSAPSLTPLPHSDSKRQVLLQPSPVMALPSSHCSLVCFTPSPHTSTTQLAEQPSLLTLLPSSQRSAPSRTPLPQVVSSLQVALQPSPGVVPPSS